MMWSGASIIRMGFCPLSLCAMVSTSGVVGFGFPWLSGGESHTPQFFHSLSLAQAGHSVQPEKDIKTLTYNNSDQTLGDPLNSHFPVPWSHIWDYQTQSSQTRKPITLRYLSPELWSPEGQIKAFSETQIQIEPELSQSHIFSQLTLATPQGRVLQSIPSTIHLGQGTIRETTARQLKGTISILTPASWSTDGQRLLVRQFEAIFGSDVSSDYAVVWNRKTQETKAIAPSPPNYDTATLMGWSQAHPTQVLFRTSLLGEPESSVMAVDIQGTTIAASPSDRPLEVGQYRSPKVADPQARR